MEVFAYKVNNEKEKNKVNNMEKLSGIVYVIYDTQNKELNMISKSGKINSLDILVDMFGQKNVFESSTGKCIVKNRDEIHFNMLLSRLRNID